jgi:hypothetical protein
LHQPMMMSWLLLQLKVPPLQLMPLPLPVDLKLQLLKEHSVHHGKVDKLVQPLPLVPVIGKIAIIRLPVATSNIVLNSIITDRELLILILHWIVFFTYKTNVYILYMIDSIIKPLGIVS